MATDLGKVGMVMKGNWNSSTAYEVLDAVSYNNGIYIAKQAVPANTVPTNTTYWQVGLDPSIVPAFIKGKHYTNYGKYLEVDISDYLSNVGNNYFTQVMLYSYGGAGGVNNENFGYMGLVNTTALYNGQALENATLILKNGASVTTEYNSTTHILKIGIDTAYNFYFGAIIL